MRENRHFPRLVDLQDRLMPKPWNESSNSIQKRHWDLLLVGILYELRMFPEV